MAKKKRTGLDALREYEAGGESVASSTTSAVETGSSTKKNRTGLDALREYETTGAQNLVKDSPFDPNYRTRTAASYRAYQNALRERQEGEEKLKQITQTVNHDQQSGYLRTLRERQKQVEPTVIHDQISGYQRTEQERQKQREATEQWPHIQKDQERGKKRTSQELQKQINALEREDAENTKEKEKSANIFTDLGKVRDTTLPYGAISTEKSANAERIEELQQRKTLLDNERALTRAQEAMNGLDDETRQLLALYNRGVYMDIEPLETRKDAYQKLVAKGYSKERIGSLAEYEQRLQDYENAQNRIQKFEEFGKNKNAQMTATLVSGLMAPFKAFGNIESVRGVLPSWAGGYQNEDMPTNIYSGYYAASQASGAIRQGVMQDMGEVGRFLYQAGTSALDSAVNMAVSVGLVGTFGLSGEAAQGAVANTMNWVMGSQVAADSVYEGIQNGKSNTDALIDGIVEGAIEGITEKYSVGDIIENMLSGRAVWKKMLRSFASEGAEEIASNWLNRVYDVVAKHDRSEVLAQYANYIAEGKSQVQALVAMAADFAKEDGLSFLAGGLSGISMSSVYAGANRVILETNVAQTARAVVEAGQVQDVIDYGLAQKEDTKAHKLAEAMQKTVDAGEEVTVQDAENVLREVAKEQQAAVDEGEEPRAPEKLTRMEQMQQNVAETAEDAEQAAANAEQTAANTEQTAQKDSYQIYRENVQDIENRARQMDEMGRQYAQEETTKAQNAAEIVRQAKQKSEQAKAAESVLRPSETMAGVDEASAEQIARMQTQEAAQELEEADARQTEEYLQQRAEKAGYDEATTSYFLSGNVTGLATEQYAEQFQTLYAQGQAGAGWQYAKRYAQGMNQDVAQAAWKAGLAAGQKGATDNGNQTVTGDRQGRNARERGGEPASAVAEAANRKTENNDEGRKRAQSARGLAKTWREVSCKELGLGEAGRGTVRVMPEGAEKQSADIRQAAKYLKSMGVKNAQFFTGQLQQEINGEMVYAEGAILEDGTVLIRADSERYSAFQLARHEGYHILAERYPAMAERIRVRLMNEGKITQEMIESYIEAYHRAYGDNPDAYAEEILADAYAAMERTEHATTPLRMDVWMETGQWTKKTGSARAPPVTKMSVSKTFADEIQNWHRSGMKTGASFVLGATGDTLQGLGAIESDIYMTGDKIRTILNDHPEMTINEIKRIPEILDDPVLILKSKNKVRSQYGNSRLVMFGSIKGTDGRTIMCVLDLRPAENGLLLDDMQKVSSAYTKDAKPIDFVQSSFVMHMDKKRTIPLLRGMGFKMPMSLLRSGSIGSISYAGQRVNLQGEKFSDVVKLGIESNETQTKTKFSMSSPTERTKDFVAVHNKDWGTIRDAALHWGGIPSPSIAIVDAGKGHSKYGDTSVVYLRATIDPATSNKNKVYGGDAWTPTARNVIVEREVDYEARRNAERKFAQLAGKVAGGIFSRESVIGSHADEVTTMDEAELARTLAGDDTVRAAYLAEQGRDIEPVLKEKVWDSFGNQALRDYAQEIGTQKLAELYVKLETGEGLTEQELETAKDSIMNAWISSHAYALNRKPELRERRIANQREKLSNARVEAFIRNAEAFYEDGGAVKGEIDRYATQDKLREAVNDKDVETWVRGEIKGILGEPGIYNGKDRFTAAGRRKSFKELHGAYTAENIVQAMNQASERGEGYWGVGASGIVSVATPEYESVEAMHADEGRLQNVSQETYDRMLRELDSRIEQIVGNVQKTSGSYDMDEIAGLLMENAGKNAAQIQRAFNAQGYRISEKVAAEIESMYRQAAQMPTGYFEAKPQRVVPFSEAAAIIAPDSVPRQEIEVVERATGANVLTYKEGDESQRLKLLNGLKGVRFSAAAQQAQEQQEKEATKSYRDVLPRKAAEYVKRLENRLVYELAENLSVPNARQMRQNLHEITEQALRAFFKTGEIDRAKMNELFEQAYQAGMEEDTAYYEQYKDIKDIIRDTTITISAQDKADIADFEAFRRAAFGTMKIGKDGRPADSFYEELQGMAPELFPAGITAPSDQLLRILDVARSIRKTEWTLDQYWGDQAASFKANQQARFSESVNRLVSGLRIADRYRKAQERAEKKLAVPQNAEEAAKLYPELKEARKAYEKVQNRQLLTEEDRKVVNRLLRGETTTEYARTLENGEAIVQAYEAKAEFDLIALRLKAWNVQRKQGLRDAAERALTEAEATKWVDKNAGIQYARETMERNVRDIARKGKVDDEKSNAFINRYFWPVHENESKRKNYLVRQQEKIRVLELNQKVVNGNLVSESYAVQWLGEAEFNAEYLQKHPYMEKRGGMSLEEWQTAILEFERQNPKMDMKKIRSAVKVFHQVYDELFQEMNRVRVENGYEPVDYTFGYFPHFQENDQDGTLLQRFAKALGVQGDVTPLPATINGLTSTFKPGIRYMANIQKRLGYSTAYDALKGMDQYLEVATDVIFHTEDIQRLRALATQIRYRASDEGLQKQIDATLQDPYLNPDAAHDEVARLMKEGKFALSGFVDELDEYINLLAGKKSRLDRGMEKHLGRKSYNVMKKFESRVGANMVAANIGSALTNFIPLVQAWAQTSSVDMIAGMWQTVKNMKQADGLDSMSSFINNRSGYDRLSVTNMDKASAIAGWLMEEVDQFTTGSVVRARYLSNLKRGMSETNAMQEADQFAAAIMADRSKGSTPTLYSSKNPMVKLFTQFQLEVNNQLSWIFKDMIPAERKKGVLALAKALFKYMLGAWIYNEIYEAIVGRRSALDPLDMINDTVGDFTGYHLPNMVQAGMDYLMRGEEIDFTTEKKKMPDAVAGLTGRVLSEFPGTQALTMLGLDEAMGIEIDNGRIAVASAIPDLGELRKAIWSSEEDLSDKKRVSIFVNELSKPAQYVAMPFGGGQLNKMVRGALTTAQGGSYKVDNEGNDVLQYPVYNDTAVRTATSLAESLLFGKTATEAAREWVESGFRSLSVKETTAYQKITEAGEDQRKTYAFINAVKEVEKDYDKLMLVKAYNISDEAKTEYYYHCIASEKRQAEMDELNGQERVQYVQEAIAETESDHNRDELRNQVIAGAVTTEKAVQKLVANDWAKDENDAYWKAKEWQGGDGYKKYDAFLSDIEAGKDVAKAAKEYLEHGVEAKTLARQITTAYKAQYLAAEGKQREKLEEKLLDMYEALGFDRDEKSVDIRSWLADEITKEYKERYIAADRRERAKMKPEILKAYVAIGYDRKERSRTIDGWVEDAKKK